jgi:outer membrane protein
MKKHIFLTLVLLLAGWGSARGMTLDDAIAIGRARSLELVGPRIERDKTKGRILEAWSNALPDIRGQVGYQRQFKENVTLLPDFVNGTNGFMKLKFQRDNSAEYDVTLNQPLFTFGRINAGLKAAYAARRANRHQIDNSERALQLEVMKRYWTVILAREVIEARRTSLAVSDSALFRVKRMRDVGLMSDYDVLRVQVQAQNQRTPLQQAENNLQLAELSLRELLGVPLDTTLTAEGRLADYAVTVAADSADQRWRWRDDLESLRDLKDVYRNTYVIFRNSFYPVLGGQVKYAWQWQDDQWNINHNNTTTSFYGGVSLSIPLFTPGETFGRAQQYKADWQRSQLDLEQAERGAKLQFESAKRNYETACSNEEAATLAVQQAEQARRIAETKLAQGQITPLEMDSAQLDELVARVSLAQARFDRLVTGTDVRMALGLPPYEK